jgi:plastocyanin
MVALGGLSYNDHGTGDASGKDALAVEVDNFYFGPSFVRGAPGQKLKLNVKNGSGTLHNVSVAGQGVDTDIPPQGKADLAVIFPPSGVVRFFCKYHAGQGMNGELLTGAATPQPAQPPAPPPASRPTVAGRYGY